MRSLLLCEFHNPVGTIRQCLVVAGQDIGGRQWAAERKTHPQRGLLHYGKINSTFLGETLKIRRRNFTAASVSVLLAFGQCNPGSKRRCCSVPLATASS